MTWNYDMESAPKGETRTINLTHHKTSGSYTNQITTKVPVLISTETEVLKTFWSETRKQWVGLSTDEKAIAWQPMPAPAGKGE